MIFEKYGKRQYQRLQFRQYGGVMVAVYAAKEHLPYIRNVETSYCGVGFMGIYVYMYRKHAQ